MKPNEIRGPVESDFGYHVIRLDGIQATQTAPLASVRAAVVDELRKQQAKKVFADWQITLAILFTKRHFIAASSNRYQADDSASAWMTAKQAPSPFNHPGLQSALFSAESLKSKQNTEAIEVQRAFWLPRGYSNIDLHMFARWPR